MTELREDFVTSAVTFLKDPQVASAPLAKKIEFLESKELTPDEIQEALSRANGSSTTSNSAASTTVTAPPTGSSSAAPPPLPAYSYATYSQPPPVPKRDWRDYFIMATVSVGVTYGLYEVAKRYVLPMIMPPTPPALEADKQALEAEFARAQALLDQLQEDTAELKKNEAERTKQVEDALLAVESAVKTVKEQVSQRDEDMKLIKAQVENIKEGLPKSLTRHSEVQQHSLDELHNELKSLKNLVTTRIKSATPVPPPSIGSTNPPPLPGHASSVSTSSTTPPPIVGLDSINSTATSSSPAPIAPRAGIPAWQLAAGSK